MYFLVYSSKSSDEVRDLELKNILEKAKKNNIKNELTGFCFFDPEIFFSCLRERKAKSFIFLKR